MPHSHTKSRYTREVVYEAFEVTSHEHRYLRNRGGYHSLQAIGERTRCFIIPSESEYAAQGVEIGFEGTTKAVAKAMEAVRQRLLAWDPVNRGLMGPL